MKITLTCENCDWNDDGLCDRLGVFVDPDDECQIPERVPSETDKEDDS